MFAIQLFLVFSLFVYSSSATSLTQQLQEIVLQEVINATSNLNLTVNEDVGLDITHFLRKYKYPLETHWVTTEDGYILRLHRIQKNSPSRNGKASRPPVLLMHGLLCSSMEWVNRGPNSSLALRLADSGYDVWLGNNRGNTWSRFHTTLDPDVDADKFFDYSFEDCGRYDLPAKIDYILKATGHEQIFYVGHSQGTSQFFAMAGLRPEYNDKVALMAALAPVVYMGNISSPLLRIAAENIKIIEILLNNILHLHELLPHSSIISEIGKLLCSDGSPFQEYCAALIFMICGFDSSQLNRNFIPVILSNTPAGISVKMLQHYGQMINSGQFNQFDYGGIQNLQKYGKMSPPSINVSAITSPIVLYLADNDLLSAVQDVERLAAELPNVAKKVHISYPLFSHMDYLVAKDINTLLFDDLIDYFDNFDATKKNTTSSSSIATSTSGSDNSEITTPNNIETSTRGSDNSTGNSPSLSLLIIVTTVIIRYVIE